jgi:hypothetical protein
MRVMAGCSTPGSRYRTRTSAAPGMFLPVTSGRFVVQAINVTRAGAALSRVRRPEPARRARLACRPWQAYRSGVH